MECQDIFKQWGSSLLHWKCYVYVLSRDTWPDMLRPALQEGTGMHTQPRALKVEARQCQVSGFIDRNVHFFLQISDYLFAVRKSRVERERLHWSHLQCSWVTTNKIWFTHIHGCIQVDGWDMSLPMSNSINLNLNKIKTNVKTILNDKHHFEFASKKAICFSPLYFVSVFGCQTTNIVLTYHSLGSMWQFYGTCLWDVSLHNHKMEVNGTAFLALKIYI